MRRYAYVILGGGCAGLSLASEIARRGLASRGLLVLERREEYTRDRTWCHWNVEPHGFEDVVAHSWSRWSVRHEGTETVSRPGRFRYVEVPADAFYRHALAALRGRAEVRRGCEVRSVVRDGGDWVVSTDRGPVVADHVFDSRPARRSPRLLQHFLGREVRLDRAGFEPGIAVLMDFDVPQDLGIHFFYVLPRDDRRALVEATWIGPAPHETEVYGDAIDAYLEQRYGARAVEVSHQERGAIPMDPAVVEAAEGPGYYRIGAAGGLVKPSTGYAFLDIQRWSRRMAARLALRDRPAAPRTRRPELAPLDRVFLSFLEHRPERAPEAFAAMFRAVDPETVVRFLTETATFAGVLRVIASMPTLPFVREAVRLAARRFRR